MQFCTRRKKGKKRGKNERKDMLYLDEKYIFYERVENCGSTEDKKKKKKGGDKIRDTFGEEKLLV